MKGTSVRIFSVLIMGLIAAAGSCVAQSYRQTNLVSNLPHRAKNVDPGLVNPWGMAFKPGQPFIVSDNQRGVAKAYDALGQAALPVLFVIPPAGGLPPASPTGVAYDFTNSFSKSGTPTQFIFAAEDGIISGWCCVDGDLLSNAFTAVDNSTRGAVYKGLAILTPSCCATFLAVTNFHSGQIESYTGFFGPLAPPGTFTDPNLPAGYSPFGIQVIGRQVFVTYALQDSQKHDPVLGAGNGIVDIFDLEGNFVRRFASHGTLNAPWGVAKASANFGVFSNDILIGNFGDGTISAFDPVTGNFQGKLTTRAGKVITNKSLWALVFGDGATGDPNTLYFTAGLSHEKNGLIGAISVRK